VGQLWADVTRAYRDDIVATGRELQFLVLLTFLGTFVLTRLTTHTIHAGGTRVLRNVRVRGVHVHHLVPGILLLLVSGYLAIALEVQSDRRLVAVAYAVGAALTLDEFALWLNLRDVYWSAEGRRSIDAVVVAATIAAVVLVGPGFWRDVGRAVGRALGVV
jgi:hypothetical protein